MNTQNVADSAKKTCKYCTSSIPKAAIVCPVCHKKIGMGWIGKIVAGFFGFVVLMSVIGGAFGSHSQQAPTAVKPALSQQDIADLASSTEAWVKTPAGQLCAKHETWDRNDCELVLKNKINIGMHVSAVVYMRGNPDTKNVSNSGSGNDYQYCWSGYTPSCFYDHNNDGIVDAFN
jgi:hypothetical protein